MKAWQRSQMKQTSLWKNACVIRVYTWSEQHTLAAKAFAQPRHGSHRACLGWVRTAASLLGTLHTQWLLFAKHWFGSGLRCRKHSSRGLVTPFNLIFKPAATQTALKLDINVSYWCWRSCDFHFLTKVHINRIIEWNCEHIWFWMNVFSNETYLVKKFLKLCILWMFL